MADGQTISDGRETAARWVEEIEAAEREVAGWRARGRRIIRRYREERPSERALLGGTAAGAAPQRRFAILWSNVQTIGPAIYARAPRAAVSRRFNDADPVARLACEVLERALNYALEEYDFDQVLTDCRQDYLLPGRGQVWMRYAPTFSEQPLMPSSRVLSPGSIHPPTLGGQEGAAWPQPTSVSLASRDMDPGNKSRDDGGEGEEDQAQRLSYESVLCDHVAWDDFLTNPAREWAEVRWGARRVFMSRGELKRRFGAEVGAAVPLDWKPSRHREESEGKDELFRRAVVWEIWDKPSGKVYWISKGHEAPLDVRDDPLGLTGFFPFPRPLLANPAQDSLLPTPDYALYQDQAEELDDLTARIGTLTEALRLVGFYSGERKDALVNLFARGRGNDLIPIEDWAQFAGDGGVRGMIEWTPIAQVIEALRGCFEARTTILSDIYQITGISDIARGESDPRETAAAQQLKTQWGSVRVRDRQKEMARFARDAVRIKGEIIAGQFSIETLKAMTGVQMLTRMEKLVLQARLAAGAAPSPEQAQLLALPSWEEVDALLKDQPARRFRIEIETDSTIEPDEASEKAKAIEFVTTVGRVISDALPAVKAAPPLGQLIAESVKFIARRYRVGRQMEDTIDRVVDQIAAQQPHPPSPGAMPPAGPAAPQPDSSQGQARLLAAQAAMAGAQNEAQRDQLQARLKQAELQLKAQDQAMKAAALQRDPNPQASL